MFPKFIAKVVGEKGQWRQYKARARQLPPSYRTALDALFSCLTAWLAPVLCFTAEEAWLARHGEAAESVHLRPYPDIPPEWRERVFEPYARRDTATARGSGIGLYAARRRAEAGFASSQTYQQAPSSSSAAGHVSETTCAPSAARTSRPSSLATISCLAWSRSR